VTIALGILERLREVRRQLLLLTRKGEFEQSHLFAHHRPLRSLRRPVEQRPTHLRLAGVHEGHAGRFQQEASRHLVFVGRLRPVDQRIDECPPVRPHVLLHAPQRLQVVWVRDEMIQVLLVS
jgi:hypothetical protein